MPTTATQQNARPFAEDLSLRHPSDHWLMMELLSMYARLHNRPITTLSSVEAMALQRLADMRNQYGITLSADVADWLRAQRMIPPV